MTSTDLFEHRAKECRRPSAAARNPKDRIVSPAKFFLAMQTSSR